VIDVHGAAKIDDPEQKEHGEDKDQSVLEKTAAFVTSQLFDTSKDPRTSQKRIFHWQHFVWTASSFHLGTTRIVEVLDAARVFGIPGKPNIELNVPDAVTDTFTTQWPAAQVPAEGLMVVLQIADVSVPPLSHPQDVEELTESVVVCPLFWKSLFAAV
jgi:hypothetical protein